MRKENIYDRKDLPKMDYLPAMTAISINEFIGDIYLDDERRAYFESLKHAYDGATIEEARKAADVLNKAVNDALAGRAYVIEINITENENKCIEFVTTCDKLVTFLIYAFFITKEKSINHEKSGYMVWSNLSEDEKNTVWLDLTCVVNKYEKRFADKQKTFGVYRKITK